MLAPERLKVMSEILKFVLVGITNVLFYFAMVYFFLLILDLNPVIANGVAYFVTSIYSYAMNSFITFQLAFSFSKLLKFIVASIFLSLLASLITKLILFFGYDYAVSMFVIILGLPVISFSIHKHWSLK
jgi:putative flippase GtrA|tara:strand:+ start:25 stop:411 length:387 start_codon:yes stop_codon:yes gene_type:complete